MKRTKTGMTVAALVTLTVVTGCGGGGGGGARRSQVSTNAAVGTTVLAGAMVEPRVLHQATALQDGGTVLITGGETLTKRATTTAEMWQSGQIVALPEAMTAPRAGHTAALLPTGEVWIAGGLDQDGRPQSTTEVWSPTTRTFRPGPALREARGGASICQLDSGIVIAGGGGGVEVWGSDLTPGSSFALPGSAVRVLDGLVQVEPGILLIAGGDDLSTGGPTLPLLIDLDGQAAVELPGARQVERGYPVRATLDGAVTDAFVVGGRFSNKLFVHLQRVRTSDLEMVQVLPDLLVGRERAAVVALERGILVAGGVQQGRVVDDVELIRSEGSSFAPRLFQPRYHLVATKLAGGSRAGGSRADGSGADGSGVDESGVDGSGVDGSRADLAPDGADTGGGGAGASAGAGAPSTDAPPPGVVRGVLLAAPRHAGRRDLRVVVSHHGAGGVRSWQVPLDPEGRFSLAGLPAGEVTLQAVVDGAAASSARRVRLAPDRGQDGVELAPLEGADADAGAQPSLAETHDRPSASSASVSGRILSPSGEPVAGATVGRPGCVPVTTGADGAFLLADVPDEALVALEVRHALHGFLRLEAAPGPALVVRLGAGAALDVRVVDALGRAAPGVDVSLSSAAHAAAAPSDATGACAFPGLAPGEPYRVSVAGRADQPGVEVVLAPGERREVRLVLR